MDKSFLTVKGQCLEPHPVILRAEGTFIGCENDIHIPLLSINAPVNVNDLMRVFRRLIELAADVKGEQPVIVGLPMGTCLDIGMKGYDCAPMPVIELLPLISRSPVPGSFRSMPSLSRLKSRSSSIPEWELRVRSS
jgi:hypothetical protein